jgi:hypothetical protein
MAPLTNAAVTLIIGSFAVIPPFLCGVVYGTARTTRRVRFQERSRCNDIRLRDLARREKFDRAMHRAVTPDDVLAKEAADRQALSHLIDGPRTRTVHS